MQEIILNTKNLNILAEPVDNLILTNDVNEKQRVTGIILENGQKITAKSVILTTGTFLRANINIGLEVRPAGRLGDKPSIELGKSLERIGFKMGRLKTGTPPRLDGRTIDFTKTEKKYPDYPPSNEKLFNFVFYLLINLNLILFSSVFFFERKSLD